MAILNNIRTVNIPSIGKLPLGQNPGTFTHSGIKREPKPGRLPEDGGHMENSIGATLDLTLNLQAGLDLQAINAVENEDITVRLANGEVHLLSQAYVAEPVQVGEGEGKLMIHASKSTRIA